MNIETCVGREDFHHFNIKVMRIPVGPALFLIIGCGEASMPRSVEHNVLNHFDAKDY